MPYFAPVCQEEALKEGEIPRTRFGRSKNVKQKKGKP
jgi:hypothetical protein